MKSVPERVAMMRKLMAEHHIDIYYIPNGDDHISDEYTADFFKCKSYISGFSGDSGCVILTKEFAGLWTDGRYFTQAEGELAGSGIELMRMGQEGVPTSFDFLCEHTPENGVLGFDGTVVSSGMAASLQEVLAKKNASLVMNVDFAGEVWGEERPPMPQEKLYILPKKYTGEDAGARIERVREAMKQAGTDTLILTQLEDPCWLLNIRGDDIACTPVAYAFVLMGENYLNYYIDEKKLHSEIRKHFAEAGVTVKPYDAVAADLAALNNVHMWADLKHLNALFCDCISDTNTIYDKPSPVSLFRAVKNSTEIKATREAHIRDGAAMARFLYWLKNEAFNEGEQTEISAENKLYALRAEGENYIEPSFPTISAYQGNAAMMHYSASEESNAKLKQKGFLLVDSGGTYTDGTTDITRTIALGEVTEEEKLYFTKVLQGMLRLTRAHFLYGTTGNNLDILARGPVWDIDIDYQCGTGHGVGHVMGVHEGPHGIRWGLGSGRPNAVLEPGMIVTNEPGVYLPHKLGIRTENELLVVKGKKNFYGQFLHFETLTFCPIDLDAVDPKLLDPEDIEQLNAYHAEVFEKLSPYMNRKEKAWLKKATRKVKK